MKKNIFSFFPFQKGWSFFTEKDKLKKRMSFRFIDFKFSTRHLTSCAFLLGFTFNFISTSTQAAEPSSFTISQTPLFTMLGGQPNLLLVLDNSGSMGEDVNGDNIPSCSWSSPPCSKFGGDDSLLSKGMIARIAARSFISEMQDKVNLGLMIYKYSGSSTPGYGNLIQPMAPLNSTRVDLYNNTSTGIMNCNVGSSSNGSTANSTYNAKCVNSGIQNLYSTPIEGTLNSAKRYFKNTLTSSENGTGQSLTALNTNGSNYPNLPPSCGKNFVILLTDGEPNVRPNGSSYSSTSAAVTGSAAAAKSLKDSGILVYVIGLGAGVSKTNTDKIAAAGGTGSSYNPQSADDLAAAFAAIYADVMSKSGAAASVATNSAQFSVDTAIYQARFNTENWYGQLLKFQTDNINGNVAATPDWDSAVVLGTQPWSVASVASNRRQILTARRPGSSDTKGPSVGIPFVWPTAPATPSSTEIATWQIAALNKDENGTVDNLGSQRLSWLRGDRSNESTSGFRIRNSVLADLVNSYPVYVGPPSDSIGSSGYSSFRSAYASRPAVIYVGGNDGFLHGFSTTDGREVLAFAPSASFKRMSQLMRQDYQTNHVFTVDGSPTVGDVQFTDGSWHTVLVSGMGGGGREFFALNITNSTSSSTASKPDPIFLDSTTNASKIVLWEFTDTNSHTGSLGSSGVPTGNVNGDSDLGFTYAKPAIVKLNTGKWAALLGNGYNNTDSTMGAASTTGNAALYAVDIETGNLIRKISVPVGTTAVPNGLTSIRTFDQNNDGKADYAYAGDLYGNIWKFDITSATPSSWDFAFKSGSSGVPLINISLGSPTANPRPITGDLRITNHPQGGQVVLFGTGRYIATADIKSTYTSQDMDGLYSVWDRGSPVTGGRSWLLGQTQNGCEAVETGGNVSAGNTCNGANTSNYFSTSTNNAQNFCSNGQTPSSASCYLGCYLDLKNIPNSGLNGERFIYFPQVTSGTVAFNTIIPAMTGCAVDGFTNEVLIDYLSCSPLSYSPYDVNGDGSFNLSDLIEYYGSVGGDTKVPTGHVVTGLSPPGTRVYVNSSQVTRVYESNSTGSAPILENIMLRNRGGRVSWRELKNLPTK